jgi:hypothetical protein
MLQLYFRFPLQLHYNYNYIYYITTTITTTTTITIKSTNYTTPHHCNQSKKHNPNHLSIHLPPLIIKIHLSYNYLSLEFPLPFYTILLIFIIKLLGRSEFPTLILILKIH